MKGHSQVGVWILDELPEGSGDEADPEEEVLGGHVGQDDQEDLWGQEVDGGRLLKGKKEIELSNLFQES